MGVGVLCVRNIMYSGDRNNHLFRNSNRTTIYELIPFPATRIFPSDVLLRGLRGLQILRDSSWMHATVVSNLAKLLGKKEQEVPALERVAIGLWFVETHDSCACAWLHEALQARVRFVEGDWFH